MLLQGVPILWPLEVHPCSTTRMRPQEWGVEMGAPPHVGLLPSSSPSPIFESIKIGARGCAHLAVAPRGAHFVAPGRQQKTIPQEGLKNWYVVRGADAWVSLRCGSPTLKNLRNKGSPRGMLIINWPQGVPIL